MRLTPLGFPAGRPLWACLWILLAGLIAPLSSGEDLVGTWKGQDGTVVVLEEDGSGSLAGIAITWRTSGKDRLRIKTSEGTERGRYVLDGDKLTTTFSGETAVFVREAPPEETKESKSGSEESEPAPRTHSEVSPTPPALQFAGEGLLLELRPTPPGFEGFLERSGSARVEVRAVPNQGSFYGAFLEDGKTVEFRGTTTEVPGQLQLHLNGATHLLTGRVSGTQRITPPPLEGQSTANTETTRFEHSRGWFSLDLPAGWTVAEETEDGLLLNPGLKSTGTLDALIVVQYGRLEEEDVNRKPQDLLDGYEAEIRQAWREQQVRLKKAAQPARAVLVGKTPGATQEWTGKSGEKDCRFWVGGLTERTSYLTVGILALESEEKRFLPQTKSLFASIRAKAPKREPALEALLAGRRVASSSTDSSGFFGTTYDFMGDGSVRSTMMYSGGLGVDVSVSGNVEDYGPYEVIGDTVYMYFQDKQESGRLVLENGRLVGIRFGNSLYSAQ